MTAREALKLLNSRIDIGFYCTPAGKKAICDAIGEDEQEAAPIKEAESTVQPSAEKVAEPEPVRAREDDGTYKGDDPDTPDVNEAYVEGDDAK